MLFMIHAKESYDYEFTVQQKVKTMLYVTAAIEVSYSGWPTNFMRVSWDCWNEQSLLITEPYIAIQLWNRVTYGSLLDFFNIL